MARWDVGVMRVRVMDARLFAAAYRAIELLRDQYGWDADTMELVREWDDALTATRERT